MTQTITLGITGASGAVIAFSLLKYLLKNKYQVRLVATNAGLITINHELNLSVSSNPNAIKQIIANHCELDQVSVDNLHVYGNQDWYSPIASGSGVSSAMVICPCSMATLGNIACGNGDDLVTRAADVTLKERKNLVLVPRETPLSAIHLDNMHKLSAIGVCILPPVIEFYTHPKCLDDVIQSIVSRILNQLNIPNDLEHSWGL